MIGSVGFPCAVVPDDDVTAAVLAFGDDPFEIDVFDGMILDVHGEVTGFGITRDAFWDCPTDEHSVDLETKVVMQPSSPMPLDHEPGAVGNRRRRIPGRF